MKYFKTDRIYTQSGPNRFFSFPEPHETASLGHGKETRDGTTMGSARTTFGDWGFRFFFFFCVFCKTKRHVLFCFALLWFVRFFVLRALGAFFIFLLGLVVGFALRGGYIGVFCRGWGGFFGLLTTAFLVENGGNVLFFVCLFYLNVDDGFYDSLKQQKVPMTSCHS